MMRTFLCLLLVGLCRSDPFKEIKTWKTIDFEFPSEDVKKWSQDIGYFKQENNLPLGLEVYKDKLFITVPRWKTGVPSSLNYVSVSGEESPKLKPYPNWETNNVTDLMPDSNETKIINVFRVRVDHCDRLWFVDCGLDDIVGNTKVLSSPKLMVYDLTTDKLLREFKLKPEDVKDTSFFANLVVDSDKGKCDESFAYLPDLGAYGLVVYDWKNNDAWRIEHHYFHFDPVWGDYNIAGVNFQWTDGIFGVSLKKNTNDEFKTLYFHPLSSLREFMVSTEILKDKKAALAPENYHKYSYVGSRLEWSQSTTSALDPETGVMFYTLINKNAVGCWNSNNKYEPATNAIVESSNVTMLFPNDLILDKNSNVWVLTDKLPIFLYRTLNMDEINFRVLMSSVKDAVKGTVCEKVIESTTTSKPSTSIEVSTSTSVQTSTASKVQGQFERSGASEVVSSSAQSTTAQPSTTTPSTTTAQSTTPTQSTPKQE